MLTTELHRAVARRTGESCQTIARRGFSLVDLSEPAAPPELCLALECPGCGRLARVRPNQLGRPEAEVECATCDALFPFADEELFPCELPLPLSPVRHRA
jgi:hypothetical protein